MITNMMPISLLFVKYAKDNKALLANYWQIHVFLVYSGWDGWCNSYNDEEVEAGCFLRGQRTNSSIALAQLPGSADHSRLRHLRQGQAGQVPRPGRGLRAQDHAEAVDFGAEPADAPAL